VVHGFRVLNFDISRDGRQLVMEAPDEAGRSRLWLAPLDRSTPVRQVPNVEGGQPHFLPDGEILFRHNERAATADGSLGFIYRVRPDGSGLRKAVEQPVNQFNFSSPVSPDGRWVFGWGPSGGHGPAAGQVYSLLLSCIRLSAGSRGSISAGARARAWNPLHWLTRCTSS
jgi:Tol biopolymer transport system component